MALSTHPVASQRDPLGKFASAEKTFPDTCCTDVVQFGATGAVMQRVASVHIWLAEAVLGGKGEWGFTQRCSRELHVAGGCRNRLLL
ncbi:MAG: hypothetical protein WC710_09205 [Gallionella sp.]